jgi:uncharacterized protein (DUF1501 family)
MYSTVFHSPSWDCHGARGFATFADYEREVLPTFDAAYCALLDDLERVGRLGSTLVVAVGEIGRSARLNADGGRDHSAGPWSGVVAGGGVLGGQAIGITDNVGGTVVDRPVTLTQLLATIYQWSGLSPTSALDPGEAENGDHPLVDAEPISELFA